MKKIQILNILAFLFLILLHICANSIAPGKECLIYNGDTAWAFGPTKDGFNEKCGFWVHLRKKDGLLNLDMVGNYADNQREGSWVFFDLDSLQTRIFDIHYIGDVANGESYIYDNYGFGYKCYIYENGIVARSYERDINRNEFLFCSDVGGVDVNGVLDISPNDKFVVVNCWTNYITTISIIFASVMFIVNILHILLKKRNICN